MEILSIRQAARYTPATESQRQKPRYLVKKLSKKYKVLVKTSRGIWVWLNKSILLI